MLAPSMSTYDIYAYKSFCQRIYEIRAADKTNGVIFQHYQAKKLECLPLESLA